MPGSSLGWGLDFRVHGLGFGVSSCAMAGPPCSAARMAPPHTRVCGRRHITRKATFLACAVELGETGSSLKPTRCDDTTGNHPNHFLLRFGVYTLNSRTGQAGTRGGGLKGPAAGARGARPKARCGSQFRACWAWGAHFGWGRREPLAIL